MRAMVLEAPAPITTRPLRERRLAIPEPAAGEVLVRVTACGICRTDLHVIEGELPPHRSPVVPGHQVVGHVERLGAAVVTPRVGGRVGIAWLRRTCGACRFCEKRRENLCERAEFTGWDADGGYAEYAVVPADFAYPIPEIFGDVEAAPLLCAGIIGYRALRLSGVGRGERLAMYGFGSSAHITLQIAARRGCEVYVFTREATHRALARSLGAAWVGELGDRAPAPVEGAIIFAPAGELVPLALRALAPGGTLALAGIHMSRIPPVEYADLFHERRVTSVTANTREDGRELLMEASLIPLHPAVTTFPLADANAALERLAVGAFAGSGVLLVDRV
ncbi:MAG TPA: zinc-dependent alcohol dehydrogenase family protein [Methylomirabilota bacterium]|nr:zinc-dependent alcohol dehydrogenase family protein [Methylomirabilota bacterium]